MTASVPTGYGVTFVLSGARETQFQNYLSTALTSQNFQNQLYFMAGNGFSRVLVTDNPADLPVTIRQNMYSAVYGGNQVGAVAFDPTGSNTAYILFNQVDGSKTVGGATIVRDPLALFVHEVNHVGFPQGATAGHPSGWLSEINTQLNQMGIGPQPGQTVNTGAWARVAFRFKLRHATVSKFYHSSDASCPRDH